MVQLVELHHISLLIFMYVISLLRSRRRLRGRRRRRCWWRRRGWPAGSAGPEPER